MKFLVAGLGNIGSEYEDTRHNIGFRVVEVLAEDFGSKFDTVKLGDIARIKYRGKTIVLLKPSTYMNRSGKAVRYWMQKENITADRVLVVVDDINLDFGRIRLRGKGSDGGHNGLKDIIQHLGKNFARLRLGIGKEFYPGEQVDYVLGSWSDEERERLGTFIKNASDAILSFTAAGIKNTMDQFNS